MTDKQELAEEAATFEQEDSQEAIPPAEIVAYNELRSCADLVRMHGTGKLELQPDFQREVVWKNDDQSRFIDSLVKQLPIPSMCFSLDYKLGRWKVIDGLQRMSSIIRFLSMPEWRLSDLKDIHPTLRRAKNSDLRRGDEVQKQLFARVEDVSIPVTVIRCDYSKKSHMLYLFTIFHRLNSGGVRLTNQEIRNGLYSGGFNDALKRFDKDSADWRIVKRRIWGSMERYRSVEVLLRVLAFGENRDAYDGNLSRFLNDYMHVKTEEHVRGDGADDLSTALSVVVGRARDALVAEHDRKLPLLVVEALLVALFVHRDVPMTPRKLAEGYANMKTRPSFATGARYAVSSVENVKNRLTAAIEAFA